jgi:hypothetical protein
MTDTMQAGVIEGFFGAPWSWVARLSGAELPLGCATSINSTRNASPAKTPPALRAKVRGAEHMRCNITSAARSGLAISCYYPALAKPRSKSVKSRNHQK